MKTVNNYIPGFLIIAVTALLSLFIFKDYGISWDEPAQYEIGIVNYEYVFHNDPRFNDFADRDYGVGFELPLIILERTLGLHDSRDIYLMRHLVQHLCFLIAMAIGYVFMLKTFRKQFLAVLGLLILMFTPRFFAHSFFNSKDIPFMYMFLICFAVSRWAFLKNTPKAYLLLGMITAYTTCFRLLAVMLFAIFLGFLLIDTAMVARDKQALKRKALGVLCFVVAYCVVLYACWPYLWRNPLASLLQAFQNFSNFRWRNNILFNGELVPSTELPWTYVPVWFGISVPVLWLALGIIGIVLFVVAFVRKPLRFITNTPERNFALYFVTLFAPVLMVIVLRSVIYDDWRHLYFIYPSFVLLLLFGVDKLTQNVKVRNALGLLCVIQFALIAVFMVRYHPYQQVYFNELLPKNSEYLRRHYELDYWGCSNKEALEYILAHDSSDNIKVNDAPTARNNVKLLTAGDRQRLTYITGDEQPDYYLDLFRTTENPSRGSEVHRIKVLNSTIMKVYRYEK